MVPNHAKCPAGVFQGLVRFATERYSLSEEDLSRKRMHITNYSVQSKGKSFVHNENAEARAALPSTASLYRAYRRT